MRRGEVWTANLNPSRGQEVGKVKLVLIEAYLRSPVQETNAALVRPALAAKSRYAISFDHLTRQYFVLTY